MTAPLRVGVDAVNLLHDRRGIGRYVRGLLRAWNNAFGDRLQWTLLLPHLFPKMIAPGIAEQLHESNVHVARRSQAERLGLDLVWYPWNGMTWTTSVRSVVTLHDVWPFASPAPSARLRAREQRHYVQALDRAARFIADSNFTKSEAIRFLQIQSDRVDVVLPGVDPLTVQEPPPARIDGASRYVLFVGEADARKDVSTLVAAMSRLPDALQTSTALVIVGRNFGAMGTENPNVRVELTGSVSDERLASLYAGAAVFAFPSRYEGFGLPVLEAMYYGAPVVASDASSVPEAGGSAALYFHAGDAEGLAQAIARVLNDGALARKLTEAGRARAATMTQTACALRTLEVFERVAGR